MFKKNLMVQLLFFLLLMPFALAHMGEETMEGMMPEHEEESGLSHQFEEISPFHHFSEGHAVAGTAILILWFSFAYTIYTLVEFLLKKKR